METITYFAATIITRLMLKATLSAEEFTAKMQRTNFVQRNACVRNAFAVLLSGNLIDKEGNGDYSQASLILKGQGWFREAENLSEVMEKAFKDMVAGIDLSYEEGEIFGQTTPVIGYTPSESYKNYEEDEDNNDDE